jgi:hypothetical protein
MLRISQNTRYRAVVLVALVVLFATPAWMRGESVEYTNLNVLVKNAETDQPIFQARLTLQFRTPGKGALSRSKPITYSSKTNSQGRYTFANIPKGSIHLFVTAEHQQSYGKELELTEDNQLVEVKLRKPQPVL